MTTRVVSDELLGQLARRQKELFNRVQKGVLRPDQVLEALQLIIEGKFPGVMKRPLFLTPQQQIDLLYGWRNEFKWSLSDRDFELADYSIPPVPQGKLSTLVLVPRLGTIQSTFDALWRVIEARQGDADCKSDRIRTGYDHLQFSNSHEDQSEYSLRWASIDLSANKAKTPRKARGRLLSFELLAAAAIHAEWASSMNGKDIPFVCLGGFKMIPFGDSTWDYAPTLQTEESGKVRLGVLPKDYVDSRRSVPVLLSAE